MDGCLAGSGLVHKLADGKDVVVGGSVRAKATLVFCQVGVDYCLFEGEGGGYERGL